MTWQAAWMALVASAGCGRIAFDPLGTNAVHDAAQDDALAACTTSPVCGGTPTTLVCNGRCISFCTLLVSQATAATRCLDWGGTLFVVRDANDVACASTIAGGSKWIGYMQAMGATTVNGNWLWLDGQPWPSVTWTTNAPDDGNSVEDGAEQCSMMLGDGTVDDVTCAINTNQLCAK